MEKDFDWYEKNAKFSKKYIVDEEGVSKKLINKMMVDFESKGFVLTDIVVSEFGKEDIKNWDNNDIDAETLKELFSNTTKPSWGPSILVSPLKEENVIYGFCVGESIVKRI